MAVGGGVLFAVLRSDDEFVCFSGGGSTLGKSYLERATYYFVFRHAFYACLAAGVVVVFSMLDIKSIRRLAILGYAVVLLLLAATLIFGVDVKGARRWLNLGVQIQPSELLKPMFIVFTAWLFEMQRRYKNFPGVWISIALCGLTCLLLLRQPDYGMRRQFGSCSCFWPDCLLKNCWL